MLGSCRVPITCQFWTYYGLAFGIPEGNSLLRSYMEYWGVGVTVVGVKSTACVLLLFLWNVASLSVSQWGLLLMAVSSVLASVVPWGVLLFL